MQASNSPPVPLCQHKHYASINRIQIRIGSIPKLFKPTIGEVSTEQKLRCYINSVISAADQYGTNYKYPRKDDWIVENQDGQIIPTAHWSASMKSGPIFVVLSPTEMATSVAVSVDEVLLNCNSWGALPTTQIRLPDEMMAYAVPKSWVSVIVHFFHERISKSGKLVVERSVRAFVVPANAAIGKIIENLGLAAAENGNGLLELYPIYYDFPAGREQHIRIWRHGRTYGSSETISPTQAGWTAGQHLKIIRSLPGRRT